MVSESVLCPLGMTACCSKEMPEARSEFIGDVEPRVASDCFNGVETVCWLEVFSLDSVPAFASSIFNCSTY